MTPGCQPLHGKSVGEQQSGPLSVAGERVAPEAACVEHQRACYRYFVRLLEQAVEDAKAEGTLHEGLLYLQQERVQQGTDAPVWRHPTIPEQEVRLHLSHLGSTLRVRQQGRAKERSDLHLRLA